MRKFLILASLSLALGGCVPVATPAMGVIFTDVKWTVDGENQGAVGSKEGKACAKVILGMVAQGDASLQAAANAGGLRKIDSVDHSSKSVLGIIAEYCTVVHGS